MEIDDSLRSATLPYIGVRTRWDCPEVGAAICRPPTPDHNRRKREADCLPYDKTRPLSVQLTRSGGRGTQERALWGRGNMFRFLPTVDRPHLKRLPGSVLWLPFLPNKKVPPPAGSDLKCWERLKFQTDKPSTAVSNPSVKNRLRRADFCHLPLHKGGIGAVRTRRILAGAVGWGRLRAGDL